MLILSVMVESGTDFLALGEWARFKALGYGLGMRGRKVKSCLVVLCPT